MGSVVTSDESKNKDTKRGQTSALRAYKLLTRNLEARKEVSLRENKRIL